MTTVTTEARPAGSGRVLRYETERLHAQFVRDMDELMAWSQTDNLRAVLGEETLAWLRQQDRELRDRLTAVFRLVIIGDFKRGKSTLVNALLQSAVVTSNITPETVTINEIGFGPQVTVEACLADGATLELQPEDLAAERLTPLLKRLPQPVDHLSVTSPVPWLRDLVLVDTPGTGDLAGRFEERIAAYLPEADAVIHVVSALAPLSESEEAFLRLAVVPHDFAKIFFVVNMMDLARSEHEAQRVLDATREKLFAIFPDAPLFGVSALDELCRVLGRPRPNPDREVALAESFAVFRNRLAEVILLNRDVIRLDRAATRLGRVSEELTTRVRRLRTALDSDQAALGRRLAAYEGHAAELEERLERSQANVHGAIEGLGKEAVGWLDAFMERLDRESIAMLNELEPEDVRQHFQFYLAEVIRQAIGQCLEAHRPAIATSVATAEQELRTDIRELVGADAGVDDAGSTVAESTFGDAPPSALDAVGTLASTVVPGLFGPLVEIILGQAGESKRLEQYRARLKQTLPELKGTLAEETQRLYGRLADQVVRDLAEASKREVEMSIAAIRQAEALCAAGEQNAAATGIAFSEIEAKAELIKIGVEEFRQKLWARTVLASAA